MMEIVGSITGKAYTVGWRQHGWSYAAPIMLVRPKFCFGLRPAKWEVLPHDPELNARVSEFTPAEMAAWFQDSIDRKERHDAAWADYALSGPKGK